MNALKITKNNLDKFLKSKFKKVVFLYRNYTKKCGVIRTERGDYDYWMDHSQWVLYPTNNGKAEKLI